jgi:hypothetical protein
LGSRSDHVTDLGMFVRIDSVPVCLVPDGTARSSNVLGVEVSAGAAARSAARPTIVPALRTRRRVPFPLPSLDSPVAGPLR